MSAVSDHTLEWNDRLQDWLDGDANPSEAAAVQQHMTDCEECRSVLSDLRALDASLRRAAPPIALDERFDARLFASIDTIDETQRIAARQRLERELQENLQALARSWRRTLMFVIPGVIGGIALAFALTGYFLSADAAQPFIASAETLSGGNTRVAEAALKALLGATIGVIVARWLAAAAE
jgi:anti-sigma factor RsiW